MTIHSEIIQVNTDITTIDGVLKGNGKNIVSAIDGTDYISAETINESWNSNRRGYEKR